MMDGMIAACDSGNRMTAETPVPVVWNSRWTLSPNRVAKTVNGVTTQYLVEDDVNPTGLPQVIEELSGPIGSGVVQRTYTYGLQRISQNLSPTVSGNTTWTPSFYVYDGFGTVRQLTNSAGTVTDTYEYDAYGNSFTKSGATPNNYLYRGEQYDSDLGLYYLRARYYNPATGRFLSRDPLDGQIKDPASLHKYLYANGDPVNHLDSTGRESMLETGSLDALIGLNPFPGITAGLAGISGTKVVIGGLMVSILGRAFASAFGWLTEELELALGPDLHDPGKGEPGEGESGGESGGESSGAP